MPDYEFGEPWEGRPIDSDSGGIYTANGYLVADAVIGDDYPENAGRLSDKETARIAACVNFCAGVPTEALEKLGLGGLRKLAAQVAEGGADHHWCGYCTVGDDEHDEACPIGLLLREKGEPT